MTDLLMLIINCKLESFPLSDLEHGIGVKPDNRVILKSAQKRLIHVNDNYENTIVELKLKQFLGKDEIFPFTTVYFERVGKILSPWFQIHVGCQNYIKVFFSCGDL
jgi:hypothetical protein